MRKKLNKIFKKNKNIVIGAVHFPPLLGYPKFPGFNIALKNALHDLRALEKGGVDGVIFENNYDIPHKIFVDPPIVSSMIFLIEKLKKATKLPLGISVLWNDYRTALSIAKILNLQFIRVPVFVDKVKTFYGVVNPEARKVIDFRKLLKAKNVALFTDIHVKHAKILSKHSLIDSARLAIKNGSDAVIVTGKLTGEAPDLEQIKILRGQIGNFPILIGSGVDLNNIRGLFQYTNGAIISTSLKEGSRKLGEVNIKPYQRRIEAQKVKNLINQLLRE